ncbi:coiled-coil domain-containing protein 6-like [Saccoglossus kowalevskii]|uniref:Coiled-coil domain-containing protein 6-like n=1 Tax=Saccoglossus kowalevskii TaxID=10224 RepID=A0ABM0GQZ8_SACKO|nr:PREDICTED: coiled-coil domain-containing protein 6-like [Saccoglossus kowalevskii]
MADSASESDTDSTKLTSPGQLEQLRSRVASLEQQNRVLKIEVETYKLKCKALQEDNRELRMVSVSIQARAEQEEEFISNTLLKKIQTLKKEKEKLAVNYEQEEEFLTNDLSRKLMQLRQEKVQLEQTLEQEQEFQVNKLMRKIDKLENDITGKQHSLEQLRREKVDLENTLEQEQEALLNRLWKRMDRLEAEKRMLQERLDQPISGPPSPRDIKNGDNTEVLTVHVQQLRSEVHRLKKLLAAAQQEHTDKMNHYAMEEKQIKEENLRLQRKLLMEMERREALGRQLSESESSLEMDDERHFNEMASHGSLRPRTVSSPIPYSPSSSRPMSPGHHSSSIPFTPPSPLSSRCSSCGSTSFWSTPSALPSTSPPPFSHMRARVVTSPDKFVKPTSPNS